MADSPAYPDTSDAAAHGAPPRTPRWVKVSGMLALIAVVVLVVMLLVGGGRHGPGRHGPGGGQQQQPGGPMPNGTDEARMPSGGGAGGHMPPAGAHR